jgi:serine/threonine-protein kinase
MSPEQVRAEVVRLDGHTDTWSLGIIRHKILTGRDPFSGTSNKELFDETEHLPAKPTGQNDNTIPQAIERVCVRALNKERSDR